MDYDAVEYFLAYCCEPSGVVILEKKRQLVAISLCPDSGAGIEPIRCTVGICQGNFEVN